MDLEERKFFEELHLDRADSARTFDKPSMGNIWNSVVEKYSDQAHFIYELIQNADDACATSARFILEKDRLIFAHNGTRRFSISSPYSEDTDSENGTLGDINAITAVSLSNKIKEKNKIGKFGVGFKAVFQYTSTPFVYEPKFKFRIDKFIVPSLLDDDFPGRKENETLFVFPFNHPERTVEDTYSDIADKLRALSFPILFLSHLCDISYEIGNVIGLYGKSVEETFSIGDIIAERICLMNNNGEEIESKYLWLFSRYDNSLKYSTGFFLDENDQLVPTNNPAFCYFPTKEHTALNFLIHGPFLLTDSREGIRAAEKHNKHIVNLLAKLAGDSLVCLRDIGLRNNNKLITDNIFTIVPTQEDIFADINDINKISFKPFYTEIKKIFENEEILPTLDGYAKTENAYWAAIPKLTEIFSDLQLAHICENTNAKWVFTSLGRDEIQRIDRSTEKTLSYYIDSIVKTNLNEDVLINGRSAYYGKIKGIDDDFIKNQVPSWLFKFYKWIAETSHRTDLIKEKAIFLDQNAEPAAVYENEHLILFLPAEGLSGYKTVNPTLLKDKDTADFLKKLGVTEPSIHDQIYNVILPQYKDGADVDTDPHFLLFFKYYCQCTKDDIDDFINEIKECEFLTYDTFEDTIQYRSKGSELYFPTKDLLEYFESKPSTKFVAYDEYLQLVGASNEKLLTEFFSDLGIKKDIAVYEYRLSYHETIGAQNLPKPYSTRGCNYTETYIDGCKELISYIAENNVAEKSVLLWNKLIWIVKEKCRFGGLSKNIRGVCAYFYYSSQYKYYDPAIAIQLKNEKWLLNNAGYFVSAEEISLSTLSDIYDIDSDAAKEVLSFLGISEKVIEEDDDSTLTDNQRKKIEIANICDALDLTEEDLREMAEIKKKRAETISAPIISLNETLQSNFAVSAASVEIDDIFDEDDDDISIPDNTEAVKRTPKPSVKVAKDILSKTKTSHTPLKKDITFVDTDDEEDVDEDEYTRSAVDFQAKVDREKEKAAKAIDRIVYEEELQQRAIDSDKYTYSWFKALLELESINSNINNLDSKEVSISFAKVERESGTHRTLILKQPSKNIPQFMEDLTDIPLTLKFGEQTKSLAIEVANVKSYTLRVKLKSHVDLGDLDLSKITEARIDAQSPVFLLEELKRNFYELGYEDDFNMQENLCENIEFIFGPPGTGKTTHLARNVIMPFMNDPWDYKVLVLTPTNKAADVLVRRIMEIMGDDKSYEDWLVRFGGTGDEFIEKSLVCKDKTFDIRSMERCVVVTTIARFPYDFFMPHGSRMFLDGMNWDYIVIDEASMIPLANIVYPLYKKTPHKFIIAGDPFQIEPITSVALWKSENIYTMVHLDSFIEPQTVPHDYKVEFLTTQYRSVPSVGDIFSHFAYGGILKHYREEGSRRPLNIDEIIDFDSLNIIKFPVSKYESIYRPKRLNRSSNYQVYSVLFTFEFASYLAKLIADANPGETFRIGIIAPYRAQSDLIDKLLNSVVLPDKVDIQVGTIHSFQGDECDIIFAVFNPPPYISASKEMFLNKRNIINVSISRAKDYLFVVMPDDDTENIANLKLVNKVEKLFVQNASYKEFSSHDIEKLMFGNNHYLEDNAFSTGHQSVNVYGLPEKYYEVRSEDNAVDVQVHRPKVAPQKIVTIIPELKDEVASIEIEVIPIQPQINKVFCKSYGEGEIINRYESNGRTNITVKFKNATKRFDEEKAYASGFLKSIVG